MGRVRTKIVKKTARVIAEKHEAKLTFDFQVNKKITEEVASIPSKRLRNKIAGFVTHLMKRLWKDPVRGISLKLQEEERELRMECVWDRSKVGADVIDIDQDTQEMLKTVITPPHPRYRLSPLDLPPFRCRYALPLPDPLPCQSTLMFWRPWEPMCRLDELD